MIPIDMIREIRPDIVFKIWPSIQICDHGYCRIYTTRAIDTVGCQGLETKHPHNPEESLGAVNLRHHLEI